RLMPIPAPAAMASPLRIFPAIRAYSSTCSVQKLLEYIERLDNSRAGTVEVAIAVGQIDAIVLRSSQAREVGAIGQPVHLAACAREIESAGRDNNHFGIAGQQ